MAEAPKGRARKAPTPAPADSAGRSYGDQQRERVADLAAPPDDADLYERVAWILENVPDVPKLGHAVVRMKSGGEYSYDYVMEPDMMNAIRPLLGRAKVAAFPSMDEVTEQGGVARSVMSLKFVHKQQSETIRVKVAASDTGDRAMVKTLTTGMRYLLQKQFMIATDGLDPEKENVEPDRPAPVAAPRRAAPKRASGKPDDLITPATRGKISDHANSLFIPQERVAAILSYASSGKVSSSVDVKTNAQFDWAIRQLDAYSADPEAAEQAMAVAGIQIPDRTKLDDTAPELTQEELRLLEENDSQPEHVGVKAAAGDDDIPF